MLIFTYRIKNVSYSNVRICFFNSIFRIYAHLGVFQNVHKNRWMETCLSRERAPICVRFQAFVCDFVKPDGKWKSIVQCELGISDTLKSWSLSLLSPAIKMLLINPTLAIVAIHNETNFSVFSNASLYSIFVFGMF